MARALLTISFLAVLYVWLKYEAFKPEVAFKKHWRWIIAALLVQAAAGIYFAIDDSRAGNFVYHAVGGGIMSTLLYIYLQKTYRLRFNWRVDLALLYAWVSCLGILNELGEYAGEFLGFGPYSFDPHDTWRDLVANTTGALLTWAIYKIMQKSLKVRDSH